MMDCRHSGDSDGGLSTRRLVVAVSMMYSGFVALFLSQSVMLTAPGDVLDYLEHRAADTVRVVQIIEQDPNKFYLELPDETTLEMFQWILINYQERRNDQNRTNDTRRPDATVEHGIAGRIADVGVVGASDWRR